MAESNHIGVQFPYTAGSAPSASDLVYTLMAETSRRFPQVFGKMTTAPNARTLRNAKFAESLMKFEMLRGVSPERADIATFVTDFVQKRFLFWSQGHPVTLEQALSTTPPPLPMTSQSPGGSYKQQNLEIFYKGRGYRRSDELLAVISQLVMDGMMSEEAGQALKWGVNFIFSGDYVRQIHGRKFVLLGGNAELSPLSHLLSAGAHVLTTHSSSESLHRKLMSELGDAPYPGRLFYMRDGVDLLISPAAFTQATIQLFAEGQKLDLGLFAYRGGKGREWRLAAVMDGIVRNIMSAGLLRSVIYYLSPSMITEISPRTATFSRQRFERQLGIPKRMLNLVTLNSLWKPNVLEADGKYWAQSILPYQGASYAAANLFGKIYAAEVYCSHSGRENSMIVSSNVAPITTTTSTHTAATRLAFAESDHFGIHIFTPGTTRALMYLLMLYDLFHSSRSCGHLFCKQIHGGVFTSPWALDSTMKLAYLRGLLKGGRQ